MAAETDLYDALSNAAAVTAIVGTNIYSDLVVEDIDAPYIYFERTNTEMVNTIHTGIPIAQFTDFAVICFAVTREAAEDLGDKAYTAVAASGDFIYTGRVGEFDDKTRLFAAALLFQHFL